MGKTLKLSELIPDDKNFNKGNEFGNSLIEKSFRKFGAGRSILLDKNNRIIAGNKSVENAGAIGLEDVQIVESDGKRIIAVKRTDIDLDSPEGREMALADNATAKANIVWDVEVLEADVEDVKLSEWGVHLEDSESSGNSGSLDIGGEDEQPAGRQYTESKYPLSIVLNKVQMMRFDQIKEKLGVSEDTTAFLKLMALKEKE